MANPRPRDDLSKLFGHKANVYVRLRPFVESRPQEPEEILLENRVYFTSIREQDDIFEGNPRLFWGNKPSDDQLRELARRGGTMFPPEDRAAMLSTMLENVRDPDAYRNIQLTIEAARRDLYHRSSILCFFRDHCAQRNWADYAGRGSGFGLAFDFRIPWRYESAPGMEVGNNVPFPVRYTDRRPDHELSLAPNEPKKVWRQIERALLTKSSEWRTQREYRLFRTGMGADHVTFPRESLRALILGYKISEENREHILAVNGRRTAPLPVFQLLESDYHYSLDCAAA